MAVPYLLMAQATGPGGQQYRIFRIGSKTTVDIRAPFWIRSAGMRLITVEADGGGVRAGRLGLDRARICRVVTRRATVARKPSGLPALGSCIGGRLPTELCKRRGEPCSADIWQIS